LQGKLTPCGMVFIAHFGCSNNLYHICGSMWAQKFKFYSPLMD